MNLSRFQPADTGVAIDAPLATLYHAHGTIVSQLGELSDMPRLVVLMKRTREIAARMLVLFNGEVLRHHGDEERELFPAVLASAGPGEVRQVERMVDRLRAEHRWIEATWRDLEPSLKLAARGRADSIDASAVAHLVRLYEQHAQFEEEQFLPVAQQILGRDRNHLEALGVALHLRRVPDIPGHV